MSEQFFSPYSIVSQATADGYTAACTIENAPTSDRIEVQIYTATVVFQLLRDRQWQPEEFKGPWVGTLSRDGVNGIRFRSFTPGKPASVSAVVVPDAGADVGTVPAIEVSPAGDVSFGAVNVPAGCVIPWAGSGTAPTPDWLLCDGSVVMRAAYPALFSVIGTIYGAGDGSTTFGLPDLRDRVPVGVGLNSALAANDGVAAANRHGTRHRHSPHTHTATIQYNGTASSGTPGVSMAGSNNPNFLAGNPAISTVDGGSNVATDPLDGPAFLALNYLIRAT